MSTRALWINGTDVATFGLVVSSISGWDDAPPRTRQVGAVARRGGVLALGDDVEGARTIIVRGLLRATTANDRQFFRDRLYWLARQAATVQLEFGPTIGQRYVNARLDSLVVSEGVGPQFLNTSHPVELRFTATDPYAYESTVADTGAIAATTYAPCALGTGPVRPTTTLVAPGGLSVSAPEVWLVRSDGTTLHQRLVFGGYTLAAGKSLIVDHDARTATVDGVSVLDGITAGDFFVMEAVAPLGNFPGSGWPFVGTPNVVAGLTCRTTFRRTWR